MGRISPESFAVGGQKFTDSPHLQAIGLSFGCPARGVVHDSTLEIPWARDITALLIHAWLGAALVTHCPRSSCNSD
jgi:hypothetical protein